MTIGLSFYAVAVPAVILFGLSKGGFSGISVLGTPMIALVVGPTQAAAIVLPILVVQDALGIAMFRRHWNPSIIATMLPGALIGVAVAYLLSSQVSQPVVEVVLGVISLAFAFTSGPKEAPVDRPPSRHDRPLGVLSGAASGFTSMIAHAGVPPFQFYVLPKRLGRDTYIGTSIVFFAATNALKIMPFAALGQFSRANLIASATLFPLALASTWLGARLVRKVEPERFYTTVRILLGLTGVALMVRGVMQIHPGL